MKLRIDGFLSELLTPATTANIESVASEGNASFSELVAISGLSPKLDFRHADLRGVDLGNSDVRGFDFTGADLRGVTGVDVNWDDTTILDQAMTNGSMFAYASAQAAFFRDQPKWYKEFSRRRSADWASATIWVASSIKRQAPDREMAIEVIKALFDHTNDNFLRSQILFFISQAFDTKVEHRDFLIHIVAKFGQNQAVLRAALRTLSTLFMDDETVFELLRRQMKSDDLNTRIEATEGVIRSAHLISHLAAIADELRSGNGYLRRMLVLRVARKHGKGSVDAVTELHQPSTVDYAEEVTADKIERIAYRSLDRRHRQRVVGMQHTNPSFGALKFSAAELSRTISAVRAVFLSLRSKGIPFWGSGLLR